MDAPFIEMLTVMSVCNRAQFDQVYRQTKIDWQPNKCSRLVAHKNAPRLDYPSYREGLIGGDVHGANQEEIHRCVRFCPCF